ncbi:hypothetical protein ACRCD8_08655 [Aliarcobacter sp. ERUVET-8]|uniref:hypothetical protein n=1 Tax=Aliarcobacter sp. ERUVET-8 TaxID=3429684 RepID=UPI003D6B0FCC
MIKKIEDCNLYGQFIFGEIKEQYKGVMPFRKFFDSHNKDVDEIVDDILDEYGYKNIRTEQLVSDYRTVLKIIVCNLILAIKGNTKYMSISLNKTNYTNRIERYEPFKITYTVFYNLVIWLADNNYIDLYKASSNPNGGIITVIKPLDILIETVNAYEIKYFDVIVHSKYEYITVKDSNKLLVDYIDNEETKYRSSILESYNKLLNEQNITIDNNLIQYPIALESKYNHSVGLNGRIYGGDWINCKSELRSKIKINGKTTKEIDIKNCSIRLAAHLNNKFVPDNIDLYLLDGVDRNTVKLISNIMLNINKTTSFIHGINNVTKAAFNSIKEQAVNRIIYSNNNNLSIEDKKLEKIKHFTIIDNNKNNTDILSDYGIEYTINALKEYVITIYNYYKLFADGWLMTGKGLELQHKDSEICFKVIEKFLSMNKVVLTVHDSFITVDEDIELLKEVIVDSYSEIVNYKPLLKY